MPGKLKAQKQNADIENLNYTQRITDFMPSAIPRLFKPES